ncbi:hypothetical protein O6H91_20G037100 [Diphasiastrum complanatum]|uniref:Uncharacterized protein n=1 Tax=Diphasiastrum complanatum TaxID=34168 RepID=A0ACC2AQI5_DIPCM|nr:hypothetical protein O6H91_20G037100 [Diphasiastrum complanatum]
MEVIGIAARLNCYHPKFNSSKIYVCFSRFFDHLSWYYYFEVHENDDGINSNELYSMVQLHLTSSVSTITHRFTLCLPKNSNKSPTASPRDRKYPRNSKVWWKQYSKEYRQDQSSLWGKWPDEKRHFTLKIRKHDRDRVLQDYLDHIVNHARQLLHSNREKQLYTNALHGKPWECVPFKHPSTFDTLALDPARKVEIINDLEEFMHGEEFYHRVGRAWKRGYLLYGPPGTGKNAELRKLLIKTNDKSIIVIEDIDCSVNLSDRAKRKREKQKSALSSAKEKEEEDERIIIFTTNHIDKLDPALMRSGRMDMHILMSHCTFPAFKILAPNYLHILSRAISRSRSNH